MNCAADKCGQGREQCARLICGWAPIRADAPDTVPMPMPAEASTELGAEPPREHAPWLTVAAYGVSAAAVCAAAYLIRFGI